MFSLASIDPVAEALLGVGFIATGVYMIFRLRLPIEERKKSCRWGRRGQGPAASVVSIIVGSIFVGGTGCVLSYHAFTGGEPGTTFVDLFGVCFATLVVCGVRDWILEDRRNKPNKTPQKTRTFGPRV